jgi:hypothetical protein
MMVPVPVPITVSLPVSTVVVPQDGSQVIVPINITSTSETAVVTVSGLPSGLQEKYEASDTNPSGSLLFTASMATPAGTYTPTVTVNSAGQTASTNFTLIITAGRTTVKHIGFDARRQGHALMVQIRVHVHLLTGRRMDGWYLRGRRQGRPASAGCAKGERSC